VRRGVSCLDGGVGVRVFRCFSLRFVCRCRWGRRMGCIRAWEEGRRRVVRVGGIHLRWSMVVRRVVGACWVGGVRPWPGTQGRGALPVGNGMGGVGVWQSFDQEGDWVDFGRGRGCGGIVCRG